VLLAFESVDRSGSACLIDDNGREIDFARIEGNEAEAGLVPLLDGFIRRHGRPSALAVAIGPGSFTGLRVAAVAARTLAWIEGLAVHPVVSTAALAAQQGDGLWWTLMPLKRDTTFHALYRMVAGSCEIITAPQPCLDAAQPAIDPSISNSIAIGPALAQKPGLAERWAPGVRLGSSIGVDARGVAAIARCTPPSPWRDILPEYGIQPAPILQRQAQRAMPRRD